MFRKLAQHIHKAKTADAAKEASGSRHLDILKSSAAVDRKENKTDSLNLNECFGK